MAKSSTSFQKGQSGNSRGKPIGATARTLFRQIVGDNLQAIADTLLANAKAGDTQAAKTLLDRLVPSLKSTSDTMSLKASGTLSEQGQVIVSAMTSGKLTPDQAQAAMNVLHTQSALVDQTEIIKQLNEFSQWLQSSKK